MELLPLGMPNALVIRAAGTNCDVEVMRGLEMAGATCDLVHLERLAENPTPLEKADIIILPGGFSYGDDIASGRIFAMHLREHLWAPLREALTRGACVAGICNGFQAMVQVGLLPGPGAGEPWPETAPAQKLALTVNEKARYADVWTRIVVERSSPCVWTRGFEEYADDVMMLPCGHGEGRLTAADEAVLDDLEARNLVALRYGENFNGSARSIAGVCDASGRVFGLMPHPDRYLDWNRHPFWTRLESGVKKGMPPGARLFANAVEATARMAV